MRQVHDYTVMQIFLKNAFQCISMAVHTNDDNEVVLINEIEKGELIDLATYDALTEKLTNLSFYNSDGKYTLVTLYNEGLPFPTFAQNYQLDSEQRQQLLFRILDKISAYDGLPKYLLPILIDENQIIISDDDVLLNEIINFDKYDKRARFQDALKVIVEKLLDGDGDAKSHAILDYLKAEEFKNSTSLSDVIGAIKNIAAEPVEAAEQDANAAVAAEQCEQLSVGDLDKEASTVDTTEASQQTVVETVQQTTAEAPQQTAVETTPLNTIERRDSALLFGSAADEKAPDDGAVSAVSVEQIDTEQREAKSADVVVPPLDDAPSQADAQAVETTIEDGSSSILFAKEVAAEQPKQSKKDDDAQLSLDDLPKLDFLMAGGYVNSTEKTSKKPAPELTQYNKPTESVKRAPKTRLQRRRRLIWLVVVILIIILFKLMWPAEQPRPAAQSQHYDRAYQAAAISVTNWHY